MKLLALHVDISGKNIVKNDIFNERNLIVLIVVEALDVIEGNRKNHGHFVRHTVFTFYEDRVFGTNDTRHGTVSIAGENDCFRGVSKLFLHRLSGFTDLHEIAASNDNAAFVNNADRSADRFLHLMDKSLKESV